MSVGIGVIGFKLAIIDIIDPVTLIMGQFLCQVLHLIAKNEYMDLLVFNCGELSGLVHQFIGHVMDLMVVVFSDD